MDNPYQSPNLKGRSRPAGDTRPYWITSWVVVTGWGMLLIVLWLSLPIQVTEGRVEVRWETSSDASLGDFTLYQHHVHTSLPQALVSLGLMIALSLIAANAVIYALRSKVRDDRQ